MDIQVGSLIGWRSNSPYCGDVEKAGRVVARSGDNLSVLNEAYALEHPTQNPFVPLKIWDVWEVQEAK